MYKPSITPEAAGDIPAFSFHNPKRKYQYASLMDYEVEGIKKQALTLHYEVEGVDYSRPGTQLSVVQMPIDNVIEMLSFAMTTITGAHELTEGYR